MSEFRNLRLNMAREVVESLWTADRRPIGGRGTIFPDDCSLTIPVAASYVPRSRTTPSPSRPGDPAEPEMMGAYLTEFGESPNDLSTTPSRSGASHRSLRASRRNGASNMNTPSHRMAPTFLIGPSGIDGCARQPLRVRSETGTLCPDAKIR